MWHLSESLPFLILFGSQSGNAEDLAAKAAKQGKAFGLEGSIKGMDEIQIGDLAGTQRVLIYCSTWGEGDMPDNAEDLWQAANGDGAPSLAGCHFAVCSLGDSSYEFFCQSGMDWDGWFEKQGAQRLVTRVDCDVDYDKPAADFTTEALAHFAAVGADGAYDAAKVEEAKAAAAGGGAVAAPAASAAPAVEIPTGGDRRLLILFGSQSGNSEDEASKIAKRADSYGLEATVKGMDEIQIGDLAGWRRIMVICSTWGEGDMPDNAEDLWQAANGDGAPSLTGVHFSVCSLGDSSYEFFCQSGMDWDGWFEKAGASRITARVDCDVDYEAMVNEWANDTLAHMGAVDGEGNFDPELVEALKAQASGASTGATAGSAFEMPDIHGETITVSAKVFRYDPVSAQSGHDVWSCDAPSGISVLQLLRLLKATQDGSLTFRDGSPDDPTTGLMLNGRVALPGRCSLASVTSLRGDTHRLRIDPLPGFDVIRDLAVDTSDYQTHLSNSRPWMRSANRDGVKMEQGVIGLMEAPVATALHAAGDIASNQALHATSDTVPHNRGYIGPAVVSRLWTRCNDPRTSEVGRKSYLEVIESQEGIKAEADMSSVKRQGRSGAVAALNMLDAKKKALSDDGYTGRHGKHVWWFTETIKLSGQLNETVLAGATLGPFGMAKNALSGVLPRMMLGFTRTGGPLMRDLQALVAPPASIGKMPKMLNTPVDNHHEVTALFNAFDRRF